MSPNNCWLANTVITIQSVYALLLNAVVLGIVFARISRPGQRVGGRVFGFRPVTGVLIFSDDLEFRRWLMLQTASSGAHCTSPLQLLADRTQL